MTRKGVVRAVTLAGMFFLLTAQGPVGCEPSGLLNGFLAFLSRGCSGDFGSAVSAQGTLALADAPALIVVMR